METMDVNQYFEGTYFQDDCNTDDKTTFKWRSFSDKVRDSDDSHSGGFDCNICLDPVQDPVVTLCGHLYCWPCIYKWLHYKSSSDEDQDLQQQPRCPVCKAKVSQDALVPLFGRGQTETAKPYKSKAPNLGIIIPRRPLACGFNSPRLTPSTSISPHVHPSHRYYSESLTHPAPPSVGPSGTTTNMFGPFPGTVGELIQTRVFGTSVGNMIAYSNSYHHLATNASPRVRRRVMQADRSLSRIFMFLVCFAFMCLLLF